MKFIRIVVALATLAGSAAVMAAGALAIDSNQGGQYGFAHDYPTMGQAERRALNECGSNCSVVLRFQNGCGAYAADQASGSTAFGWGTGPDQSAAKSRARGECRSRGGSSCIIRSWGCNSE